jgi:hypothetical protein
MIAVKDSHTRIKPLALASGHGRYTTVTPERTIVSVGKWPLNVATREKEVHIPTKNTRANDEATQKH